MLVLQKDSALFEFTDNKYNTDKNALCRYISEEQATKPDDKI